MAMRLTAVACAFVGTHVSAGPAWDTIVATAAGPEIADRVVLPPFPRAAQIKAGQEDSAEVRPEPASRKAQEGGPRLEWKPSFDTPIGGLPIARSVELPERVPAEKSGDMMRFSAPSLMTLQHAPLPEGEWSAIITGALGGEDAASEAELRARQRLSQQDHNGAEPAREAPAGSPPPAGEAAPDGIKPEANQGAKAAVPSAEPAKPVEAAPASAAAKVDSAAEQPKGAGSAPAAGEAKPAGASPAAAQQAAKPLESLPPGATPAQQYCFNTTETAADARFAWQAKKIAEMEGELQKRVELVLAKTEEYKTWLARRDEFSKKAHEKLVGVYTRMRPDAAALQLAALEEETAAAVLMKLETKVASAVMGEMETERAARLAAIISGAGKVPADKVKAPAAAPAPAKAGAADNKGGQAPGAKS